MWIWTRRIHMAKILVVEDEPDIAETLQALLSAKKHSVKVCLDSREAVGMADGFDLILLDLMMPLMSGEDVLKELRAKKVKTPVILMSAIGSLGEKERGITGRYPGVGFILKPEFAEKIDAAIKAALKK